MNPTRIKAVELAISQFNKGGYWPPDGGDPKDQPLTSFEEAKVIVGIARIYEAYLVEVV